MSHAGACDRPCFGSLPSRCGIETSNQKAWIALLTLSLWEVLLSSSADAQTRRTRSWPPQGTTEVRLCEQCSSARELQWWANWWVQPPSCSASPPRAVAMPPPRRQGVFGAAVGTHIGFGEACPTAKRRWSVQPSVAASRATVDERREPQEFERPDPGALALRLA